MRQIRASLAPPPEEPTALADFPRFLLERETKLFRVGRGDRSPWWFGSSGAGRFDLQFPQGTCYLAGDPLAALLEVVGSDRDGGFVSLEQVSSRHIYHLRTPTDRHLADLATSKAAAFGVTLEVHSIVPYDLPQRWAARLHEAEFEGLRYLLRHDPAGEEGFALFDSAGAKEGWSVAKSEPIGAALLERLEATTGFRVAPIPHSREILHD